MRRSILTLTVTAMRCASSIRAETHADLTGEYAAIPAEMKRVAKALGGEVLREVSEEEFYKKIPELRKEVGDRAILRAIHFFDDNRVVDQEVAALKSGDFETFKQCVIASGHSSAMNLQNVFAVVNPQEQGLSLALALMAKILGGKGAYRVHGGGFAGTVQAYVPARYAGCVQGRDAERVWRKELLCALRAQRGRHESDNRISLTAALIFRAAVFAYCGKYVLRNCKYWETVDFALRIMPICGIVYSVSL